MGIRENIAESLDIPQEHVTWAFVFLYGTMLVYASSLVVTVLPVALQILFLLVFLVFWLGSPVAMHLDRTHVAKHTDWTPSRAYYLCVLPSYVGLAVLVFYVYQRSQH